MNVDEAIFGILQEFNIIIVDDPHSCVGCKIYFNKEKKKRATFRERVVHKKNETGRKDGLYPVKMHRQHRKKMSL